MRARGLLCSILLVAAGQQVALAQTPAKPDAKPIAGPGSEAVIDVRLKDAPFRQALKDVFSGSGLQYSIAREIPDVPVSLTLSNVPRRNAIRAVTRQASTAVPGLTYSLGNGIYMFRIREDVAAAIVAATPVSLQLRETPLREALIRLFEGAKQPFSIAPDVPNVPVTLQLSGLPRNAAIRAVMRQASLAQPGLTYQVENGVHTVFMREPRPLAAVPAGRGMASQPGAITGIARVYGNQRDNSLLVQGTPESIRQLREMVQMLDVPRQRVQVRISAGTALAAEGETVAGAPLQLTDSSGQERLTAVLLPRVNGDGSVEISIDGKLTRGAVSHPLRTTVRLAPGAAKPIFTLGTGARERRIWLRAVPIR